MVYYKTMYIDVRIIFDNQDNYYSAKFYHIDLHEKSNTDLFLFVYHNLAVLDCDVDNFFSKQITCRFSYDIDKRNDYNNEIANLYIQWAELDLPTRYDASVVCYRHSKRNKKLNSLKGVKIYDAINNQMYLPRDLILDPDCLEILIKRTSKHGLN